MNIFIPCVRLFCSRLYHEEKIEIDRSVVTCTRMGEISSKVQTE